MKKILLLIGLLIYCTAPALANCDYMDMCPKEPTGLSSKRSQTISKVCGLTFIAEKIAQHVIKSELKKATKERFAVSVKSYSAKDLSQGKFKSMKITGRNLHFEGKYLTELKLQTLCNFNSVDISKKTPTFRENMVLEYTVTISDYDLKRTMKSSGYLDKINSVNLSGFGVTFFKLEGADIIIDNDKLYFIVKVKSQFLYVKKPVDIVVSTKIKVEDGKIILTEVAFEKIYTKIDLSKIAYLLNAIDPLTFSLDVLENKDTKMSVRKVDIIGDKFVVQGNIFIPKTVEETN